MALSKIRSESTDGSVAGGKVLQVVHAFHETEESLTIVANTPQATGLTATIIPTDVTSKILVTYTLCTSGTNTTAPYGCYHMVYHDIGQTGTDTAFSSRFFGARYGQYQSYAMTSAGGQIYHDHNTTSAIDYTIYADNNTGQTLYINRGGNQLSTVDGVSSITLTEISQ